MSKTVLNLFFIILLAMTACKNRAYNEGSSQSKDIVDGRVLYWIQRDMDGEKIYRGKCTANPVSRENCQSEMNSIPASKLNKLGSSLNRADLLEMKVEIEKNIAKLEAIKNPNDFDRRLLATYKDSLKGCIHFLSAAVDYEKLKAILIDKSQLSDLLGRPDVVDDDAKAIHDWVFLALKLQFQAAEIDSLLESHPKSVP